MDKLKEIRKFMKNSGVDMLLVPSEDPHGSEYIADHFKERQYLTNFTGSAGTALVTMDNAYLWTDGRYYIQAANEIKTSGFDLMKQGLEGVLNWDEWAYKNLDDGNLGFNFEVISQEVFNKLKLLFKDRSVEFKDVKPLYEIWEKRPELPKEKVYEHDIKYSGEDRCEKIARIRNSIAEKGCEMTVISTLDDIAWTLNLRGDDIYDTPVFLSYLIIDRECVKLYVDLDKVVDLQIKGVELLDYDKFYDDIKEIKGKDIYLDPKKTNHKIFSILEAENKIVEGMNFSLIFKSMKNETEIENLKEASIKDGVYLSKFIYWLKNEIKNRDISEIEAAKMLGSIRSEDPLYKSDSFETISAYGPNAAMMHYNCNNHDSYLKAEGLYLIDSGAQYLNGTTDITRTIVLGEITDRQKKDFTIVLKAHLHLMKCIFLNETLDSALDAICRYYVWQNHYDYKCGTGHGVGYFLSVHEGPQKMAPKCSTPMRVGMVVSNEPGIYREGEHGIRTENIHVVVHDKKVGADNFLKFETISFAPIDNEAIDLSLLDDDEILALNEYHKNVYDKLSPHMEGELKEWLKDATRELER